MNIKLQSSNEQYEKKAVRVRIKICRMASNVNSTHNELNEILKTTPNKEKLASIITRMEFWKEVQRKNDVKLIKRRISELSRDFNTQNYGLYHFAVEAILDCAVSQFEKRVEEAKEAHLYALNNERKEEQRKSQ